MAGDEMCAPLNVCDLNYHFARVLKKNTHPQQPSLNRDNNTGTEAIKRTKTRTVTNRVCL